MEYLRRLDRQGLSKDMAQANAVEVLQALHTELTENFYRNSSLFQRMRSLLGSGRATTRGIYLWGGVGRGKTWLMDLFYDTLPLEHKLRFHFHRFMQTIHDQLSLLKGQTNPLTIVARNLSKQARILCLDEFHVEDITDAMILHGLLHALVLENVTLVYTSNLPPDDLYRHGLQRDRFLPAIELIKQHSVIVNVDGGTDYRLRLLEKADTWYSPIDDATHEVLRKRFIKLAPCPASSDILLQINYRNLLARLIADDIVWFEFDELCAGPRATNDYIEIARRFHTVMISNIPVMTAATDDKAKRFIHLVDEFYDRNVKLIASSEAMPAALYEGQQFTFEFQRTSSRLLEMRSHEYLSRPHKP
ncbi:MAG: cell division protein ZapE [Gammaproteobacteria bacterium]|nr:MAG: cell division protein ZapE [Gammaproteobacteria bacterium]